MTPAFQKMAAEEKDVNNMIAELKENVANETKKQKGATVSLFEHKFIKNKNICDAFRR